MQKLGRGGIMNKSPLFLFLGAAVGFVAGYIVSAKITKKKYETLADKEVESVKEALKKHYESKESTPEKEENKVDDTPLDSDQPSDEPVKHLKNTIKDLKIQQREEKEYIDYSKQYRSSDVDAKIVKKEEPEFGNLKPYVISPQDFSASTYRTETLYYYEDKVLADSDGERIDKPTKLVGPEALNSFGKYNQDDCVYVRDDELAIDYEIILIHDNYVNHHRTKDYIVGDDGDDDIY